MRNAVRNLRALKEKKEADAQLPAVISKLDKLVKHKNPMLQMLQNIRTQTDRVSTTIIQLIHTFQNAPIISTFTKQWQCLQATSAQRELFDSILSQFVSPTWALSVSIEKEQRA
jgi:hypothetical protein